MNDEGLTGNEGFVVDEEFKNLLPPLSAEDFENLEKSILSDGCRDPLVIWQEERILIDGYHRHEICTKHGLSFKIEKKSFANRDAALDWMIENQRIRRNMNRFQWAEVILKRKESIAAKAKMNQKAGGGAVKQKSAKPVNTLERLAKLSGISRFTLQQVAFILKHADQNTIGKLRKGDVHYSINGVSEELRELIDKKKTKKSVATKSKRRNHKPTSRPIPKASTEPSNDIVGHILATLEELEQQYSSVPDRVDLYNTVGEWVDKKKRELILSEL